MHMQAQSGRKGIAPTHSQHCSRRRWMVNTTLRSLYSRERTGAHCTGDWVGFGAGLTGTEDLTLTGIRCPDLLRLRI
jgi:hypothetical protein